MRDFIVRIKDGHQTLMTLPETNDWMATDEERRRAVEQAEKILREEWQKGRVVVKVAKPKGEGELVQPHQPVDLNVHHYESLPRVSGG